jgi:hypothetical protein
MIAGRTAWSSAELARRQRVNILGRDVDVASPEDVILGKMIYFRDGASDKHLRDVAGILSISRSLVDLEYINKVADQLGLTEVWQLVLSRVSPL